MVQPPGKAVWRFLRKLKIELLHDSLISFPGVNPEELRSGSKRFALSCSLQPMTEE